MNPELNLIQKIQLALASLPLHLLAALPQTARLKLGRTIGRWVSVLIRKRRHIMAYNLTLAFPEQSPDWRQTVIRQHLERLGEDAMESFWVWYGNTRQPPEHMVTGAEHIEAALARGQGVILNAGHFTPTEIAGYLAAQHWPIHAVYRPNNNPVIDELINRGRRKHVMQLIDRENTRGMIRTLRQGGILWTAADQSFHGKQSAYLPFFGVRCATNTAIPAMARMGNAAVLPFYVRREGGRYHIVIHPPLEHLPSGDDVADTARLVTALENEIRVDPSAYLWGHRRYKDLAPKDFAGDTAKDADSNFTQN
ncbi:MAG: lysophospholipid acyltransferase family protein [Halothiobacillus sp.]